MTSTPSDPWGDPSPDSSPPSGPVTPGPSAPDPFSGDPYAHNPFATPPPPSGPAQPAPHPPGGYQPGPTPPGGYQPGPTPPGGYQPGPGAPGSGAPAYGIPGTGLPGSGAPAPGQVIVQVGEIAVTSSLVRTPAGDIPLGGSSWQVADYWHHEQRIPQWAIIAAVVGFCVLTVFSLLFLLAKETIARGTVQVTVTNGTQQYVARIPVTDQNQVAYIHQQVNYVRSLAAL